MMGTKARIFSPITAVSLEDLVPQDHFYRRREQLLGLTFVRELVQEYYACGGRRSIDPVVFFKLQLIMFLEGLRSERQLMRLAADRLSLHWYLGYDLHEALPDHSSLPKIRDRYEVTIFRRFFADRFGRTARQCYSLLPSTLPCRRKVMGNIKKIGTHIKVSNFAESRAFYLALGFQPIWEYAPHLEQTPPSGPEEGSLVIFATEDGTALLEIGDSHPAINAEVFKERVPSSKVSLMVHVGSLEEIIDRAEKAKIAIARQPVNFEWGTTELVIRDPDGFVVVFIAQTTEEHKKLYPTI